MLRFPDGFAWGTATASYQIEGGVTEGGRGRSIWDTFSHAPGNIARDETGDVAADHYHRYPEDVALLAGLGVSHYRFSVAWPRVQPDGSGKANPAGLDFYGRLVDELLGRGIQPWVTLYHWDLPQALEDRGGWPERDTALRFAEYAAIVHERLGDRVEFWTTLNEPWVSAFVGYGDGKHAPGRADPAAALRAAHHLMLGHGLAVEAMRAQDARHRFGVTLSLHPVDAASDADADRDAARRVDGVSNRMFLDPLLRGSLPTDLRDHLAHVTDWHHVRPDDLATIATPLDLLGVNYYFRQVVRAGSSTWWAAPGTEFVSRGRPATEMGWEIDPDGLYEVLTRLHREYGPLPLYVTENGAAFADQVGVDGAVHDQDRVRYLTDHFRAAHRAIADGVDLRGYFVWSLLDNYEWADGYDKRFGLIYVDYQSLQRIPKDSARFFAEVTSANAIPAG